MAVDRCLSISKYSILCFARNNADANPDNPLQQLKLVHHSIPYTYPPHHCSELSDINIIKTNKDIDLYFILNYHIDRLRPKLLLLFHTTIICLNCACMKE